MQDQKQASGLPLWARMLAQNTNYHPNTRLAAFVISALSDSGVPITNDIVRGSMGVGEHSYRKAIRELEQDGILHREANSSQQAGPWVWEIRA